MTNEATEFAKLTDQIPVFLAIGTILAAFLGPLSAVALTFVWERIRRVREQKQTLLQTLLSTRGRYADPGYSWAIRTVPLQFSKNSKVLIAHDKFMDATRYRPTEENSERHQSEMIRLEGVLISEILQDVGFKGFTSEQLEQYTAQALADRDQLLETALRALPHLAVSAKRSADINEKIANQMGALAEHNESETIIDELLGDEDNSSDA